MWQRFERYERTLHGHSLVVQQTAEGSWSWSAMDLGVTSQLRGVGRTETRQDAQDRAAQVVEEYRRAKTCGSCGAVVRGVS